MHLSTTAYDGVAHILNDCREFVGADMWMGIDKDIRRCAMLAEYVEYLVDIAAFLAAGVEFAVGECTCTSFTEGIVRLRIDCVLCGDTGNVLPAFVYILSAFNDNRPYAEFYQTQSTEKSTWTCSDDNGLWTVGDVAVFGPDEFAVSRLLANVNSDSEVDEYSPLTCIDAAFQDADMTDAAKSFLVHYVVPDATLARCYLWQDSYLVFLYHVVFCYLKYLANRQRPGIWNLRFSFLSFSALICLGSDN